MAGARVWEGLCPPSLSTVREEKKNQEGEKRSFGDDHAKSMSGLCGALVIVVFLDAPDFVFQPEACEPTDEWKLSSDRTVDAALLLLAISRDALGDHPRGQK